ncbi:MAG: hypothetical protein IT433_09400 [Phycisphaerales bacterium]|nr:hypothetical protein [Phycisphaerales bacterium]
MPKGRVYSELSEFRAALQPIFDALPHLAKDDVHKLGCFCPADFNKDDTVDEADARDSMRRLRESDCDPAKYTEYRPFIC